MTQFPSSDLGLSDFVQTNRENLEVNRGNRFGRTLEHFWNFREGSLYNVKDLAGNLHASAFTVSPATSFIWQADGLEFAANGNTDRLIFTGDVYRSHFASLYTNKYWTIGMRLFIPSGGLTSTFPRVIDISTGAGAANGWAVWYKPADNVMSFAYNGTGNFTTQNAVGSSIIPRDTWFDFYIARRFNTIFMYLPDTNVAGGVPWAYKMGSNSETNGFTHVSASVTGCIGNWNHAADRAWDGKIAYIGMWSEPFTETDDIQALTDDVSQMFWTPGEESLFDGSQGFVAPPPEVIDTPVTGPTFLNIDDKSADGILDLSNNFLTVTRGATSPTDFAIARASQKIPRYGKWYFELTWESDPNTGEISVGLSADDVDLTRTGTTLGLEHYRSDGDAHVSDSTTLVAAYGATWDAGDVIGVAYNADVGEITYYKNGVSQGVAETGISLTEDFYPAFQSISQTGMVATLNFGNTVFTHAAPAGFAPLWVAYTRQIWSLYDNAGSSYVDITEEGRQVERQDFTNTDRALVRSVRSVRSGDKIYFEFTASAEVLSSGGTYVGVCTGAYPITTTSASSDTTIYAYGSGGEVSLKQWTTVDAGPNTYTTGDIIGVSIDPDDQIEFFKNGVSEHTVDLTTSGALDLSWYICVAIEGQAAKTVIGTMNFGRSGFAYSPPAGYEAASDGDARGYFV